MGDAKKRPKYSSLLGMYRPTICLICCLSEVAIDRAQISCSLLSYGWLHKISIRICYRVDTKRSEASHHRRMRRRLDIGNLRPRSLHNTLPGRNLRPWHSLSHFPYMVRRVSKPPLPRNVAASKGTLQREYHKTLKKEWDALEMQKCIKLLWSSAQRNRTR